MINGKTKLIGIMGDPIAHTLSPAMHNAAFKYLGLNYKYIPFQVKADHLKAGVKGAVALNIKGYNVTIPHKTTIMNYLDKVEETANLIGAVNTVKIEKGQSKGYNTDGIGAVKSIQENKNISHKKVIILGAGGAAKAISYQLLVLFEVELVILNRTISRAMQLKYDLEKNFNIDITAGGLSLIDQEIKDADILIDTTPRGMHPHENDKPLVRAEQMHPQLLVNDLVYNPLETSILKEANKAGATSVSGLKMLLYQGIESFKIWTGEEPPLEIMEKTIKKIIIISLSK